MGDHKVMLAKVTQATPVVCVNQGARAEEEDSIFGHPTILVYCSIERELNCVKRQNLKEKNPCVES